MHSEYPPCRHELPSRKRILMDWESRLGMALTSGALPTNVPQLLKEDSPLIMNGFHNRLPRLHLFFGVDSWCKGEPAYYIRDDSSSSG